MQIQNTSFFAAEEIVTIKMFKAIYTQQFALSLTHLIAKQIQNFVTRNRKLSNNIEANSKHQLFFTAVVQKWKTQNKNMRLHSSIEFQKYHDTFRAFPLSVAW